MSEMTPAELEAKNQAEAEAKAKAEAEAKAAAEAAAKKNASLYEEELQRVKAEKEKSDEIARQKSGALKETREELVALKAKLEELEAKQPDPSSLEEKERIESLIAEVKGLKESVLGKEVETVLGKLSSDPKERELVKHHYENSIKQTGNVEEDLRNALLLANKKSLIEAARNEGMEHAAAEVLARISGTSPSGNRSGDEVSSNPEMEKLVAAVNPKAVERFREYMKGSSRFVQTK